MLFCRASNRFGTCRRPQAQVLCEALPAISDDVSGQGGGGLEQPLKAWSRSWQIFVDMQIGFGVEFGQVCVAQHDDEQLGRQRKGHMRVLGSST